MVGTVAWSPREKVATLLDSAKFAIEIPSKLQNLRQLNDNWFQDDPVLISEFLPNLFDLQTDGFSPVRKFVTRMIGEIGLRHVENLPEIVPVLMLILQDSTPAVARQAITCGIELFRFTLEKVALQGLYSSELDESLEASWAWMLKFKDKIYSIAFQPGSDSIRLLSLKFVEAFILLYTSDPNGSSEPPSHQDFEGRRVDFNVSWLRGGHPLLKVGEMSIEASQSLGSLLDQLRSPKVKSLSSSMIVVLVNSLAAIAMKRPIFYGRILPVLLGLDPSHSTIKGVHVYGAHYTLKKAFLSCLKCTHPSAVPWRQRLTDALNELQAGGAVGSDIHQGGEINGSLGKGKVVPIIKDEKPSIKTHDPVRNLVGKKRPIVQNIGDACEDENGSGKRTRLAPDVPEESSKQPKKEQTPTRDDNTSIGMTSPKGHVDSGPVQQLVAMFRALVAQGEKAAGSLEILISSISADLLTDVVMANMQNLPPRYPKVEGEDDSLEQMGKIANGAEVMHSLTLLADVFSCAGSSPQIASSLAAPQSVSDDLMENQGMEGNVAIAAETDHDDKDSLLPAGLQASSDVQSEMDKVSPAFASGILGVGDVESEIPGLESVHSEGLPEPPITSSLAPLDSEEAIEEQATNLVETSPMHLLPSMSNDRSEELSSKSAATDANNLISSTATSVRLSQIVLPKLAAPVINLTDQQRDNLQMVALTRIIDAYKQIAVAGGSHDRVSLLAYLGVEFSSELDPWKLLQKHILSDYITHEGQEFTLRVLYRLFGESEAEHDFFSSTNAKSVYETFVLIVAETLRDSFPASDKSLSKLLVELPYLPKSIFTLLEQLCCPENGDREKESLSGDRVTQGLSATWSLILTRPPIREACLNIALQSAVHPLEEVRMKAIRLVANKLYPIASIAQRIEEFAKEVLLSVVNAVTIVKTETEMKIEAEESHLETPLNELLSPGTNTTIPKQNPDTLDPSMSESLSSSSSSEAQRCMSLYFALCTKKHSLFREIFVLYRNTSASVKQAVHRHIPVLVRTIGPSTEILEIISDPPAGSEDLLMQVLNTLTEGAVPSPGLIHAIRKSYGSNIKNAEILIPVLPFLPTDEILSIFPHIVNLPLDKFQAALARVIQKLTPSGPVLTPAEVLIAIHGIDPDRDGIPLKKVTDACNACFEQRQTFTQQVLAKVLNQLVEQIPLPLLFMRTVLQAIGAFPPLVGYIMEILSRLVSKQIWKYPKQWVGFLKCAQLTKPQSFSVLLQLPPAQLENALNRIAALKAPLVAHASQPNIKSSLPRSVLVVLGIVTDSQPQASQPQASQAQTSQIQTTSQTQTSQAQTSQTQTSQAQTEDSSNVDREQVTETTKESSSGMS